MTAPNITNEIPAFGWFGVKFGVTPGGGGVNGIAANAQSGISAKSGVAPSPDMVEVQYGDLTVSLEGRMLKVAVFKY